MIPGNFWHQLRSWIIIDFFRANSSDLEYFECRIQHSYNTSKNLLLSAVDGIFQFFLGIDQFHYRDGSGIDQFLYDKGIDIKILIFTSLFKTILLSFLWYYRNVNPIMLIFRDGKFSTHHSRQFSIPHSWFSSCGKIKIPHSRGIFISPSLLNHSWGVGNCFSWFLKNFQFLTRGFVARSGIIPSLQISMMGSAQSMPVGEWQRLENPINNSM